MRIISPSFIIRGFLIALSIFTIALLALWVSLWMSNALTWSISIALGGCTIALLAIWGFIFFLILTSTGHLYAPTDFQEGSEFSQLGPVYLGASAPMTMRPGNEFTARFVAYVKELEEEIHELLNNLSPRAQSHLGIKTCYWRIGTQVKVRLTGRFLIISQAEREFVWEGTRSMEEFDVSVVPDASEGVTVLKFDLFIDGVLLPGPRVDLEIKRESILGEHQIVTAPAAQTAFASYSSEDRPRVLDRIASIRITAGLDVFQDCLSLNPNDQWKARLEREIQDRDLFLLFWSTPAAKSPWVEWEWQTALKEKGKDLMQIHPLEYGLTPPEPLQDIHFGDPSMAV